MTAPVEIVGDDGTVVKVSTSGELSVAPVSPNISQHWSMTTVDTAYTFAPPISGKEMRLQNILIYGNKNVGASDATVVIYTSHTATGTTPLETILELELPKYAKRDLIGLNLQLSEGVFLNAKTDDNTIFLTMMGYYLDI